VSLPGPSITVQSINVALVKLQCLGVVSCHGKLTLTARSMVKGKGKKKTIESAVTIGTVSFSISGKEKKTVRVKLNATGRTLLDTDIGRLTAGLAIRVLEPDPPKTKTESVVLILQKPRGNKRKNK
jgi:hypothetical protein